MSLRKPLAVDLFAGCGGLSRGLRDAGFELVAAVELDQLAAATFRVNHPRTKILLKDICHVTPEELLAQTGGRRVDLVAGCAPCQGFCSMTSKQKREDPRNALVLQMARLIEGIRPAAVMMENVSGLAARGAEIFGQFLGELDRLGYLPEWKIVQMADYGVPQSRRRLVLLAGQGFRIPLPEPTHGENPNGDSRRPWLTLRHVIGEMSCPVTLSQSLKNGGPRRHNWHVVRDLQPQTKRRLQAATPGKTWLCVDEDIRPKCHRNGYDGFTNVYGRMAWDQTPATMTGGCTTPCKGRFGHPDKRRTTISVREAAMIQTFPKNYHFETDQMDAVCDMIGNAVPPRFARIAGRQILRTLAARR